MPASIDELLQQVQELKTQTTTPDPHGLIAAAEDQRDRFEARMNQAIKERDAAVAELAKVKADVQWTMGKLLVRDVMYMRGEEVPAAAEGWLPGWGQDPEDTARIAWLNEHGRLGFHEHNWLLAIPHSIVPQNESLPEIYNLRHIIDVSRRTCPKGK
jgi:hypothetical protein